MARTESGAIVRSTREGGSTNYSHGLETLARRILRRTAGNIRRGRYLRRTRVPRTFCVLSTFRKRGMTSSISSKYDDSAGTFCCDG
jgi:hypothetical protein